MHLQEKPVSQDWTEERTEAPVSFSMWELLRSIIRFSWGRPIWSWQTLVSLLLVGLAAGAVVAHRAIRGEWAEQEFFSEVLLGGYVGFLLPVLCLSFGTQLVSGAWEEGWLIWLLLRPIPRGLVYGLLLAAAVPWTLALTLGGALLLAALAGHATFRACLSVLLPLTHRQCGLSGVFCVSERLAPPCCPGEHRLRLRGGKRHQLSARLDQSRQHQFLHSLAANC
jgi:hypothetical protein